MDDLSLTSEPRPPRLALYRTSELLQRRPELDDLKSKDVLVGPWVQRLATMGA